MLPTEATLVAGRYQIIRSIAAGGMGAVYEVLHVETNRKRALKVMHRHLFKSETMRERFKREARIAADVESEHIVDVFDAGVDEATGMPFFVMELLRGEDLGERLARSGRFEPADVIEYLRQTASALDRTHAASIVHRDLKPANLFLMTRGDGSPRIKILDFGIAKLVFDDSSGTTGSGLMGTPLYMAPEQFRSEEKLTGATDIYALGLVAYTLLVGKPYWIIESKSARDVIAFALIAMRGPQESAVQRAAYWSVGLPASFDAWFARATAVDPLSRFRTATEAVEELQDVFYEASFSFPEVSVDLPPMAVEERCQKSLLLPPDASIPQYPPAAPPPTLEMLSTVPAGPMLPVSTIPRRKWGLSVVMVLVLGTLGTGSWLAWGRNEAKAMLSNEPETASSSVASAVVTAVASGPAVGTSEPIPGATQSLPPSDSAPKHQSDVKKEFAKIDSKSIKLISAPTSTRASNAKPPKVPRDLLGQK